MPKSKGQIPKPVIERFVKYYHILNDKEYTWGKKHISSFELGQILNIEDTQIRNDFMHIEIKGKPKVGYIIEQLKDTIANLLGFRASKKAILIGVGHLGLALAYYPQFSEYGLKIQYLFDIDDEKIGNKINNIQTYHIEKIPKFIKKSDITIGIITTPREEAQKVADLLVASGIRAIWNFAPVTLSVPEGVLVQNENLSESFAFLSHFCSHKKPKE